MKVNTRWHTYDIPLSDLDLYDVFDVGKDFITVQVNNSLPIPDECKEELYFDAFQSYQRDADHEGIEDEELVIRYEIAMSTRNKNNVSVDLCGCVFSPRGDISFGDGFDCLLTSNELTMLESLTGFYSRMGKRGGVTCKRI